MEYFLQSSVGNVYECLKNVIDIFASKIEALLLNVSQTLIALKFTVKLFSSYDSSSLIKFTLNIFL